MTLLLFIVGAALFFALCFLLVGILLHAMHSCRKELDAYWAEVERRREEREARWKRIEEKWPDIWRA